MISPDDPTPGTVAMTRYLYKAFANDLNDRLRDGGGVDPRSKLQARDTPLPPEAGAGPSTPPRRLAPFPVYEGERVRVAGTLVDHGQVYPSFGFRFDTDDGAVVFSGDTAPLESHTTIEGVGPVADRAGVRILVLNHFVPANNPPKRWRRAKRGFSGRLIVGDDLMQIVGSAPGGGGTEVGGGRATGTVRAPKCSRARTQATMRVPSRKGNPT